MEFESFGGIILHFVRSLTKREQQQKRATRTARPRSRTAISFAKATLSDLRTRLSPELFEAMVFVAQNADQLEFTWEEVFDEYKKLLREATAAAAAAT